MSTRRRARQRHASVDPAEEAPMAYDSISTMKALILVALLALVPSVAQVQHAAADTTAVTQVKRATLKVTTGSISETKSEFLTTTSAKMRAIEKARSAQSAELRFRYRGPSEKIAPLASGMVKRQIGLKMRAKDTCNLLYVMWEIARITTRSDGARDHRSPEKVVISVKRNPGKKTHSACGAGGYETIAVINQNDPSHGFASARDNKTHRLHAKLFQRGSAGYDLFVYVDGKEVWNGSIAYSMLRNIDGPAGLRSDNGSFIFKFFTGGH